MRELTSKEGDGGVVDKAYVLKLISEIKEAVAFIETVTLKPFESLSEAERYAIRYNLIVVAESLAALALHMARRMFRMEPETPIHALRILRDEKLIDNREFEEIVKLIKLRNILVHRYWVVDDRRIYDSVRGDFKIILKVLGRVEGIIGEGLE